MIKNNRELLTFLLLGLFTVTLSAQLHYENFIYNGFGGGALMSEASSIAVSPDGNYIYVTSAASDAINVFNKGTSSPSGELTFVEVVKTGLNGIQGLTAAQSVVVSPDGNHVYAVGTFDDALVTFSRSNVDGTLSFVEMHKDGLSGVDGLDAPYMVKVSPDGNHVYVSATDDNAISVFDRDALTGALTFNAKFTDPNFNIILGFDISQDGQSIYVASHANGMLVSLSRNMSTGALSFVESFQDNIDFVDGLSGAFSTYVSPDGKNVYVSGAYDNAVAIFARDAATNTLSFQTIQQDGQSGVNHLNFPLHVTGSPDGNYVYAVGANDNAITVFEREPTIGILIFKEALVNGTGGIDGMNFPVNIAVSPDGEHVYTAASGSGAAVVFDREATGDLTFVESQMGNAAGVTGLGEPYSVAVSPDGEHVYAASNDDNALAIFSRSNSSGELTFVNKVENEINGVGGLDRVYSVVVSPDGNHVYTAGNLDDAIAIFSRDALTGELIFVNKIEDNTNGVDGLNGARFVTLSPDGNFVYAAGFNDDAITVFSRDVLTGDLTFIEMIEDNENGVDGLNGANSIAISNDGTYAYTTGFNDDAIAMFSRNVTTGTLTFIESYKNGVSNVNGLNGAHSVVISNDGKSVYACGFNDDAVVAFNRNVADGKLTFVNMFQDGVAGVDGLGGARAVALNPDDNHLYAVSGGENAIVLFERDAATGALTYQFKHEDGISGINGLNGARGVTLDPFGKHIYVAGADDDAVAVFSCTYFENMTEDICEGSSIMIGNNSYTETGIYEDVIEDTFGCRSVVTLNLTVSGSSETLTAQICEGDTYQFGNQVLTTSGTYQEMISNAQDCNVNTTLTLTVTPQFEVNMSAQICEGDTYSVGSNTFVESGIYTNNFIAANGCDSVVVLDLTVNQTAFNDDVSICNGDQYLFGSQTINSSGTYQESFTSSTGCDSIVTLQLAVVNSLDESIDAIICIGGSFTIGTQSYSNTGTYTELLTSNSGCDSIVTLNLTVSESINLLFNETICEGEVYNLAGTDYSTTGVHTESFTTNGGCDSTLTVNLTVLPGAPSILNETICEGESFNFGSNIYTVGGEYTSLFSNPNGCETLVTLNLEVQGPQEVELDRTICEGESYPFGTQMLTQSGTYTGNFTTLSGCDSIITLNLTVNPTQEFTLFETICNGDIYTIGNQTYAFTGTYVTNVNSVATGCDSLVTLNLTVIDINGGALITNDDGSGIGAINITVSNGTPPYTFEWNNGEDTEDINGLSAGVYSVLVNDANGCSETLIFTVDNVTSIFNPTIADSFEASVYPNPVAANDVLNILIANDKNQMFEIKLFDAVGRLITQQQTSISAGEQLQTLQAPQNAGIYYLQIVNENQEVKSLKVMVH